MLLVTALAALTTVAPARAQTVEQELTVARDFFLIADYASALDKVDSLLRGGGLDPGERRDALELEARCHVALGSRMEAIDSFCSALQLAPDWRPDLDAFTEAERDAFAKAFELCGPLAPLPQVGTAPPIDPAEISPPTETGEEGARRFAAALDRGRPWYRNPWVLGSVGGVIAGAVLLTLGGEESAPPVPLPGFPPPPE